MNKSNEQNYWFTYIVEVSLGIKLIDFSKSWGGVSKAAKDLSPVRQTTHAE